MQQQQAKTRSATQAGRRSAVVVSAGLRWFSRPATPQAPIAPSSVRPSPAPLQRAKSTVERALGLAVAVKPAGRLQHVAVLVQDLERALAFYQGTLGLDVDTDRPHNKLPYRGAWLSVGPEMIHLMELPEGGRDRRVTVSVPDIKAVLERLGAAGVPFTLSRSGSRPAAVLQDPDQNIVEVVEHAYA